MSDTVATGIRVIFTDGVGQNAAPPLEGFVLKVGLHPRTKTPACLVRFDDNEVPTRWIATRSAALKVQSGVYEIDRIVDSRQIMIGKTNRTTKTTRKEYLVCWHGYTEPTWEPAAPLIENRAVVEYELSPAAAAAASKAKPKSSKAKSKAKQPKPKSTPKSKSKPKSKVREKFHMRSDEEIAKRLSGVRRSTRDGGVSAKLARLGLREGSVLLQRSRWGNMRKDGHVAMFVICNGTARRFEQSSFEQSSASASASASASRRSRSSRGGESGKEGLTLVVAPGTTMVPMESGWHSRFVHIDDADFVTTDKTVVTLTLTLQALASAIEAATTAGTKSFSAIVAATATVVKRTKVDYASSQAKQAKAKAKAKKKKVTIAAVKLASVVPLRQGDACEANFDGGGTWYGGTVGNVRDNGNYDIVYDDGDDEKNVAPHFVRGVKARRQTKKGKATAKGDDAGEGIESITSPTVFASLFLSAKTLAKYQDIFIDGGVDGKAAKALTDDKLKTLGVGNKSHRVFIFKKISNANNIIGKATADGTLAALTATAAAEAAASSSKMRGRKGKGKGKAARPAKRQRVGGASASSSSSSSSSSSAVDAASSSMRRSSMATATADRYATTHAPVGVELLGWTISVRRSGAAVTAVIEDFEEASGQYLIRYDAENEAGVEPVWVRDLSLIETQLLFSPQFTELAGIDREELLHMHAMSSIFIEESLSLRGSAPSEGAEATHLAWSSVDGALAVARGNLVEFFDEDGQQIMGISVRRGHQATAASWHPSSKTVAIGWSDGTLTIFNCNTRSQREDGSIHRSPIRLLEWSPSATRLVSGDEQGTLGLWTLDLHSRIIPICQHPRKQGAITHCTFFDMTGAKKSAAGPSPAKKSPAGKKSPSSSRARASVTSFFFAVRLRRPANSGSVLFADDMGHCMTVCSTKGSPVVALLQHSAPASVAPAMLPTSVTPSGGSGAKARVLSASTAARVLYVVSADLLLRQFSLSSRGEISPLRESKLAHAGADVYFSAMWAVPGLLITASGEGSVRFYDVEADQRYSLPLTSHSGVVVASRDAVSSVAYCAARRMLIVGTKAGTLLTWRYAPNQRGGAADATAWTPASSRELAVVGNRFELDAGSDPIQNLVCGPREASAIVAACSRDGVSILSETILSHCVALCGNAGAEGESSGGRRSSSSKSGDGDGSDGSKWVVSAVQIDAETIIVERMAVLRATEDGDDDRRIASAAHPAPFRMRCGLRIHGVAFDGGSRRILVWSGRVAEVYYVDDGSVKSISRFETRAIAMAIRGESIFAAVGDQIVVMNDEGVVKQRVTFLEAEGAPRLLDLNGRYLAVATSTSLIKRYDVSRRSLKLLGSVRFGAKSLLNLDGDDGGSGGGANGQAGAEETVAEKAAARRSEALDLFFQQIAGLPASQMSGFSDEHKQRLGHIKMTSIKISADGARVSLLAELPDGAPDPRLHIWQADEGLHDRAFACHHFGEMSTPRYPIAHHWDAREHRLLVVESAIMRVHGDRSAGVAAASAAAAVAAAASKEGDEASKLGEGSAASATTAHSEAELAALERLVTTLFVASADELRRSAGLEGKSEEESNLAHLHNADSPRARRQRGEAARSRGHTVAEEDMDDAAREGEVEPTTGVMVQDVFALPDGMDAVSGMHVPHIYFVARKGYLRDDDDDDEIDDRRRGRTDDRSADRRMSRELMRDFVGLERVDNKTRRALLDFSYNLTLGLVDEAFHAVRLIESVGVWRKMAFMCVKTKRLDVAGMCLGKMGHAAGAATVREVQKHADEDDVEVGVAMVATQLGLLDEAGDLYVACERYDCLNTLYRSAGHWSKAVKLAETKDRLHLKTTHFELAQQLEAEGDVERAMEHYEASGCSVREIPRMMLKSGRADLLEAYVQKKGRREPELCQQFAQWCEMNGHVDAALKYYDIAGDDVGLVRVHCAGGDTDAARDVVARAKAATKARANRGDDDDDMLSGSGSDDDERETKRVKAVPRQARGAALQLAQHFEHEEENIAAAIEFYCEAGRYGPAVRLAMDSVPPLDDELQRVSLLAADSNPSLCASVARAFEKRSLFDRAVRLWHRAGRVDRALGLCFRARLFDDLDDIATELADRSTSTSVDPAVLQRCATYFQENGHADKAVSLLVGAGKPNEALELCMAKNIKITSELAEKLTPEKKPGGKAKRMRAAVLMKLAGCLEKQRSYQLATKKYTQANSKMKALKCLLKSGDTKKIVYYATHAKKKEIYVTAANFLRNLEWQNNPDLTKQIIKFYRKAKTLDKLGNFYDACAQFEIDDFSDYEKALQALQNAQESLSAHVESGETADVSATLADVTQRVEMTQRFVQAQRMEKARDDAHEMLRICESLLHHQPRSVAQGAVREGDVFALMIKHHHGEGQLSQAYDLVRQMQDMRLDLGMYTEPDMLTEIYESQGMEYSSVGSRAAAAAADEREHRLHSSSMDAVGGEYEGGGIDDGGQFDHYDSNEEEEQYGGK